MTTASSAAYAGPAKAARASAPAGAAYRESRRKGRRDMTFLSGLATRRSLDRQSPCAIGLPGLDAPRYAAERGLLPPAAHDLVKTIGGKQDCPPRGSPRPRCSSALRPG